MTHLHSFRLPITKWGAVSRLALGMVITFMAAVQMAHTAGKPVDGWVIFGAILLTLKDAQSFINQAWGQAFLTKREAERPDAAPEAEKPDAAPSQSTNLPANT